MSALGGLSMKEKNDFQSMPYSVHTFRRCLSETAGGGGGGWVWNVGVDGDGDGTLLFPGSMAKLNCK